MTRYTFNYKDAVIVLIHRFVRNFDFEMVFTFALLCMTLRHYDIYDNHDI